MARPKRLSPDAEPVGFYLTPEEQLVLQIIRVRRKKRAESRVGPSEVVSDALWLMLSEQEGLTRHQVDALLARPGPKRKSKVQVFLKPERR